LHKLQFVQDMEPFMELSGSKPVAESTLLWTRPRGNRTPRSRAPLRRCSTSSPMPVSSRVSPTTVSVGLGESSDHALELIEKIVHEATCPVIALIHAPDPDFVREASKRGIFACITDSESKDWQNSIDIVLRRFAEYHHLEGAFGRRAVTERAKGILMERHSVDESAAFEMLREHSRSTNRKLVDVASAIVDGHRLLLKAPAAPASAT
jgi:AmiR/NasT family two-component response regulator